LSLIKTACSVVQYFVTFYSEIMAHFVSIVRLLNLDMFD